MTTNRALPTEHVVDDAEARAAIDAALPLALSLTRCPESAQDLVMDALCRCLTKGQRTPGNPLLPYLIRAVRNRFFDECRKRRRAQFESLDDAQWNEGNLPAALHCSLPSPEIAAMQSEEARMVRRALQHVPPLYRTPLLLSCQRRSLREIAALTGANENTVKSRIRRGRRDFMNVWNALNP